MKSPLGLVLAGAVFASLWTVHLTFGLQWAIQPMGGASSLFASAPRSIAGACFALLFAAFFLAHWRRGPAPTAPWWIVTLGGIGVLTAAAFLPATEMPSFESARSGLEIVGTPDGPTSIVVTNRATPAFGFLPPGGIAYLVALLAVFAGAGWVEARTLRSAQPAKGRFTVSLAGVLNRRAFGWATPLLVGLVLAAGSAFLTMRQGEQTDETLKHLYSTATSPITPQPSHPIEMGRVFDGLPTDQKLWFGSEWGFVGFLDPDAYVGDLGGKIGRLGRQWTPEMLLTRAIEVMNDEEGFFWGSAEATLSYHLNPPEFDALRKKARAVYSGFFSSSKGRICLTDDGSLAAVAQLPEEYRIPVDDDIIWRVRPGRYSIEVLQFFRYDASAQCPGDCDPDFDPEAVHYAIRIRPVAEDNDRIPYSHIPNQAGYYRLPSQK